MVRGKVNFKTRREPSRLFECLKQSLTILTIICIIGAPTIAGDFICGDINGDLSVNIGDAVFCINFVFKGGTPPEPIEVGDTNGDNGINIGDVVYLINYIFKGGTIPLCSDGSLIIDYSECKGEVPLGDIRSLSIEPECIDYEYDGVGTLWLTHTDVSLNCCPNGTPFFSAIASDIEVTEGVIVFDESDNDGPCKCSCPFDISYRVVDVTPGVYTVRFFGLYTNPPENPLEFTIDLSEATSGHICDE